MSNLEYSDRDCTVYVGSIAKKVTEEIIFELFLQAGPLERVTIPKDKESGLQKAFGFVTFTSPVSVSYAIDLLDGTSLYGQRIVVRPQTGSSTPTGGSMNRAPGSQSPATSSSLMGSPNFLTPIRQNGYDQNVANPYKMPFNSPLMHGPTRQNRYEQNTLSGYGFLSSLDQLSSRQRSSQPIHRSTRKDSYEEDRHQRQPSSKHSYHHDNTHRARSHHDQRSSRY